LQDHPSFQRPARDVDAEPRAFDEHALVFAVEIVPVFPANARLDDGLQLPVSDRERLRRGRGHLGACSAGVSPRDEPRCHADAPHGRRR